MGSVVEVSLSPGVGGSGLASFTWTGVTNSTTTLFGYDRSTVLHHLGVQAIAFELVENELRYALVATRAGDMGFSREPSQVLPTLGRIGNLEISVFPVLFGSETSGAKAKRNTGVVLRVG